MSMLFKDALALDLLTATDAQLAEAWHSYASTISYHHADDSGKEWGAASAIMVGARKIECAMRERGLARPTGQYLMSDNDRIDWETGDWSPGWAWKKAAAHRVQS
jgi:hypothetical protein